MKDTSEFLNQNSNHLTKASSYRKVLIFFLLLLAFFSTQANNDENIIPSINYKIISEQVYVHTDRDIYVAGENLFFKLYLLNGLNGNTSRVSYLVIRNSNQKSISTTRVWLDNSTGYGHIHLPDTLSTGQYQLVSYTNWMRGNNESYCFTKELFIVNRFDENFSESIFTNIDSSLMGENTQRAICNSESSDLLEVGLEKNEYNPRSKISLKLKFNSLSEDDSLANVSISVVDVNSCFQHKRNTSVEWYNSFKGKYNNRGTSIHYNEVESDGLIISGKISNAELSGLENQNVFLSTPDSVVNLQYEVTDPKGDFRFMIGRYYEGKDLFIKPFSLTSNSNLKISIEDKYTLLTPYTPTPIIIGKGQQDKIKKSQSIVTVNKAFESKNTKVVDSQFSYYYCPQLYSKPDQRVFPSDYVALGSIDELIQEIVYGVRIRKRNNYTVSVLDSRLNNYFENGSFIFLDGVLVDNLAEIIDFGTDKIKSIDVINSTWVIDDLSIPGILSLFSKNKEIYRLRSSTHGQIVCSVGEYLPRTKFVAPEYGLNTQSNRIPDFRQLLYWNPQEIITKNSTSVVSFYSSDYCTEYLVVVDGFTMRGEPISVKTLVKVSNKNILR